MVTDPRLGISEIWLNVASDYIAERFGIHISTPDYQSQNLKTQIFLISSISISNLLVFNFKHQMHNLRQGQGVHRESTRSASVSLRYFGISLRCVSGVPWGIGAWQLVVLVYTTHRGKSGDVT